MPLRDDLLKPISEANPGGEDVRYKSVYEQLKEARRQEEDLSAGEWVHETKRADWNLVLKLGQDVLAKQSKDLQVAAWLSEALVAKEGYRGLKQGLDLCRGMIEQFWDSMYPELEDDDTELRSVPLQFITSRLDLPLRQWPLMKGGIDYLKWKESTTVPTEKEAEEDSNKQNRRSMLVADGKTTPEQVETALKETPVEAFAQLKQDLDASLESLNTLDTLAQEKFGEYAPGFGAMRETLEELQNTARILFKQRGGEEPAGAEEAPAEEPPAGVEEGPVSAPAAREPQRPAPAGAQPAVPRDLNDAAQRIAAVARWYREQNPQSAVPYLILRGLRWGELRDGGTSPGWDILEAPATGVRQNLKKLQQEGDSVALLEAAEQAMAQPCGRAWLDLQRYVLTAAEAMGANGVTSAVQSELKTLLADYPGLLEWTLTDDTPAANPQTVEFLKSRGLMGAPQAAAPEPGPPQQHYYEPPPAEPPAAEAAEPDDEQEIRLLLSRGRTEDAIQLAARKLVQESSGRGRFRRRTQLAQIMMAAGRAPVALPMLKELVAEIEERRLEQWEAADVLSQPLVLYWRALEKVSGAEEERQRVFALISRLDPMRAFELG